MKAQSQAAFDRIAGVLQRHDYRLRIEGHTDNTPIHNLHFRSNWELSTTRATEIVRRLIARDGFGADRLSAAGYAEYHPIASNDTVAGRGTTRRVDIVVLGQKSVAGRGANEVQKQKDPSAAVGIVEKPSAGIRGTAATKADSMRLQE